jgi:serine/threonine protein kinase
VPITAVALENEKSCPPSPVPPSRRSDRALIEDALNQVSPRPSDAPSTPTLNSGAFPGYTILREIHRGGQGVVYQALQLATKRKVAIKVIHGGPFTGSQGRARFEREVQILGQLNHRNIVAIHDSGVAPDGSFFYVMDYISGRSLDEVLRASKDKPDIETTLQLFIKVCDAVNAAHLKGVIHRDLKPSNIFLTDGCRLV